MQTRAQLASDWAKGDDHRSAWVASILIATFVPIAILSNSVHISIGARCPSDALMTNQIK